MQTLCKPPRNVYSSKATEAYDACEGHDWLHDVTDMVIDGLANLAASRIPGVKVGEKIAVGAVLGQTLDVVKEETAHALVGLGNIACATGEAIDNFLTPDGGGGGRLIGPRPEEKDLDPYHSPWNL